MSIVRGFFGRHLKRLSAYSGVHMWYWSMASSDSASEISYAPLTSAKDVKRNGPSSVRSGISSISCRYSGLISSGLWCS